MRHRVTVKKLSKTPAHRKAMIRNMLIALYRHETIKTTLAKSKVLQRIAERVITRAKVDSVHNRREVAKWVQDKDILNKLFTEIGPRFKAREGGYTRIVKIGPRQGDASEMVYIALVEEELNTKKKVTKSKSIKAPVKAQKPEVEVPAKKEVQAESSTEEYVEKSEEAVAETGSDLAEEEVKGSPEEDS